MSNGHKNIKTSRFSIVDLAGSERSKDTGAEGKQLQEANAINKSLSVLSSVINKLAEKCKHQSSETKQRQVHINYRDSKLTYLLQDSLGGNSKTVIICNVNPHLQAVRETRSTLQFAQRAKLIQNQAEINLDTNSAEYWKGKFQALKLLHERQHPSGSISRGAIEQQKVDANVNRPCQVCQDRLIDGQQASKDFEHLYIDSLKVIQGLTTELKEKKDQLVMDGFEKSQLASSLEQMRKSLKLNLPMLQNRVEKLKQRLLLLGDCAKKEILEYSDELATKISQVHPEFFKEELVQLLLQRGNELAQINEGYKEEIEAMSAQIEDQKSLLTQNPLLVMKSEHCRELEAKLAGANDMIKSLKMQMGLELNHENQELTPQERSSQRLGLLLEELSSLISRNEHAISSKRMNQHTGKTSIKVLKREVAQHAQLNNSNKDAIMIDETEHNDSVQFDQDIQGKINQRNRDESLLGYQSEDEFASLQTRKLSQSQRGLLEIDQKEFRDYVRRRDDELANIKLMYEDQLESIRDQLKQEKKRNLRMQSLFQKSSEQLISSQFTFAAPQPQTQGNDEILSSSQMTQMTYLNRNGANLLSSQNQFSQLNNSQRLNMSQMTSQSRTARNNAQMQGAASQDYGNLLSSMNTDALQGSNMMMNSTNSYNSGNTPTVKASSKDLGSDEVMSGGGSSSGLMSERFDIGPGLAINQMQINTIDERPEFDNEQPAIELLQEYQEIAEQANEQILELKSKQQLMESINQDLREERDRLSARLDQTQSEKISLESLKVELMEKIEQQQAQIEELQSEVDGLLQTKGNLEKTEQENAEVKNSLHLTQKELEELSKVNDFLQGEVASMTEELSDVNKRLNYLQIENQSLLAMKNSNAEKDQLETEIANLRREYQSQLEKKRSMEERINQLQQQLKIKEQTELLLKEDNEILREELSKSKANADEILETHEQLRKLLDAVNLEKEQMREDLQQEHHRLQKKLERYKSNIVLKEKREIELQEHIESLNKEREELECKCRQLQGHKEELSENVRRLTTDKLLYKNMTEQQLVQIQSMVDATTKFRKSQQDRDENKQSTIDSLKKERDYLKRVYNEANEKLKRLNLKTKKMEELYSSISQLDKGNAHLAEIKSALQSTQSELNLYKGRVVELERQLTERESEIKKLKGQLQAVEREKEDLMNMGDKGKFSHYQQIRKESAQMSSEINDLKQQLKSAKNEKHQVVECVRAFGKEFTNKINQQNKIHQNQPGSLLGLDRVMVTLRNDPERSVRDFLNEIILVMTENFTNLKLMLETPIIPPGQKPMNVEMKECDQVAYQTDKTPLNLCNPLLKQQDVRLTNPFFKATPLADMSFPHHSVNPLKPNQISPSNSFMSSLNNSFANQLQSQPANQFASNRLSGGANGLSQHQVILPTTTNIQAQLQKGLQPPHQASHMSSYRPSFTVTQDQRQEGQVMQQQHNSHRGQAQTQQISSNGPQSQMIMQAGPKQQTQPVQHQQQLQVQNDSWTFEEQRNRYKPMGSLDSSIDEASMIQDRNQAYIKENESSFSNQQFMRQGGATSITQSGKKQPQVSQQFSLGVDRQAQQLKQQSQQNQAMTMIDLSEKKQRMITNPNNIGPNNTQNLSQPQPFTMNQQASSLITPSGGKTLTLKANFNSNSQAQRLAQERPQQLFQNQDWQMNRQPSSNSQERNLQQQFQYGQRKN